MTSINHNRSFATAAFALAITAILSGCGGSGLHMPETGSVEGVVTMDGNPLPNVSVVFQPQGDATARPSMGVTDDQGHYSLSYHTDKEGALIGTHKVSVTTPTDAPDPSGQAKDPIPAKYNTATELTVEVKAGSNEIPLELSSK